MNLNSYYTEEQAHRVLFRSPISRRERLNAVKKFNRWWYPREATRLASHSINEGNSGRLAMLNTLEKNDFGAIDLDCDLYVNLKDAMVIWPYSREYLYKVTLRADNPKIKFVDLDGRTVFLTNDIHTFLNDR